MFLVVAVSELETMVPVEADALANDWPVWFSDTPTSGGSFDRNAESTHVRMTTLTELSSSLCSQDSISNR